MTKIELLQQPDNKTCGQTCVAMIANISIERSVALFGHSKKTKTIELIRVLRGLGFRTANKLHVSPRVHRKGWGSEALGVLHVKFPDSGHWVIHNFGEVLDPIFKKFDSLEAYEQHIKRFEGRVVSALRVWQ